MKSNNKTVETSASVTAFLKKVKDEKKRSDCEVIIELVKKHTGLEPKMWGTAIVGFGSYHYVYESGREGDAPLFGLAARVNAITLYLSANFKTREALLAKFGKHTTSKGCVYIKKLEDIDTAVLIKMVKDSMAHVKKMYPA
ncbi:MAG: DUF1801 domain-containing protein [Agriterribacter sp.]